MIYEFICYPHEICWRPQEVRSNAYNHIDYISAYTDNFTFADMPSPSTARLSADLFDSSCLPDSIYSVHVKEVLKGLCDSFIDSLGYGEYAFNLHNNDFDKGERIKPHFHVVFSLPFGKVLNERDVYKMLGMYTFVRDDFMHGKTSFTAYSYKFPPSSIPRFKVYEEAERSDRLRYLCHLDVFEKERFNDATKSGKNTYSFTDVIASFDYVGDPDVIVHRSKNIFALFLAYKRQFELDAEWKFYEWLANYHLDDDTRRHFTGIRTQIHYYYQSLRYK